MSEERHWTLADIPWHELERDRVADSEELFYMVSTASLIEITTDLYTRNLTQHFAGDEEVAGWLRDGWEPEELQHGQALREYVRRAWPDFDWDAVYRAFLEEYGARCKPEALLPLRSLEMVSRCVVEMGTSTYYTALHHVTDEPVLKRLARHIYEDEIGHYKHFYKYFRRYREREGVTRAQVLGALWHRLKMIEEEDSYIALKHVYAARHPGRRYDKRVYRRVVKRCRRLASPHVPHERSVKMLLKPLDMAPTVERWVQPVMESVARAVA
ncbi:MAG: ferritin-like domain-containing protein [Sinobacteraceae bacterium]|nr:ferritin-like domain-containing protein [Nevskia sp.]MDI3259760.1 ferritin-like domain-containing protein [Nevskiaceae bacterium]